MSAGSQSNVGEAIMGIDCDCYPFDSKHDQHCERASMKITKAAFVVAAEGGVKAAFESYKTLIGMGFVDEDALEMAIEETRESATCFAGIGSCGGGGCKHA
ncbi:hypothetical protein LCGC14_1780750 [marine sediment metagenome]|uniref:Uncharacterized protein n=1 Tax=marine sediment metagenome TaxID=412755 RepID=A0A0F9JV45_9ZZZZ